MPQRFGVARLVLVGLVALSGSACTLVSTGARSAVVVLVPDNASVPNADTPSAPPREELQALLSRHFLWLASERRAAQWIAYVNVRVPPTPLQPFSLALLQVKKNPDWRPLDVSDPIASRDSGTHPSLRLAEQNEQWERSRASSTR